MSGGDLNLGGRGGSGGGGGGSTDLGYTAAASQGTVTSSTGTSAVLPVAATGNAGLVKASERAILTAMDTTPAQGDVIYYNGTAWVRLGAGTSGHFLKTNGAGANPAWAAATAAGSLLAANNLSDVASAATSRTNLGLAAIAASGSASDLASGTVPTARLGSGTANSTTFLRGDGTWATPAGGSASPYQAAPLAANLIAYGLPGRGMRWLGAYNLPQGFIVCAAFACSETEGFDAYDAQCNTGVASTLFDIAIYSCSDWKVGTSATKVAGTEVTGTSLAAAGAKTIVLAARQDLPAGRYILACVAYNGASAVSMYQVGSDSTFLGTRVQNGTGAGVDGWIQTSGATSLPASFVIANGGAFSGSLAVLRRG